MTTTVYDDIRSKCDALIGPLQAIRADADAAEASSGGGGGITWPPTYPAGVNCLAGTVPTQTAWITASEQNVPYFTGKCSYFERLMDGCPTGSIPVFGDSIIEGMDINQLSPIAVNLGIGGDTMRGILTRFRTNASEIAHRASCSVLAIGINDICVENNAAHGNGANLPYMLDFLSAWMTGKWVIVKVLPINESMFSGTTNALIDSFNAYLQTKFDGRAGFTVVDLKAALAPSGQLAAANTIDGLHLSAAGKAIWINSVRAAL